MASNQTKEPTACIKSRFSTQRFENVVKNLTYKQRKILIKYWYDRLLDLKIHVAYPLHLIDWIVEKFITELALFKYGTKQIKFNASMVQQFIGDPSGDIPVSMSSDDPATMDKVNILKKIYMVDGKLFTKKAIELLVGDEDEESFMVSFILVGYMDMLDINSWEKQHQVDYGVSRIYHVRAADFQHVIQLDSDLPLNGNVFGVLNLREISCTPYSESAIKEANVKEKERHQLALLAIGYGSTGPRTSHQQVNSDQAHNAPNDAKNATSEIKTIIDSIIQSHKAELFRDVHKMVDMTANTQFCLMSEAINSDVSQHLVTCEANIANRSKSWQNSVERDEGKGEATPGVHSDAIP